VIISWPRREAPAVPKVRAAWNWAAVLRQHRPCVVGGLVVLGAILALDVVVALHPAPLPGDVGSVLAVQRLLLPHKTLTLWLEQVSTVTWPITALETIIAAVALLLLLRRWLDALLVAVLTGLGSGSSYLTNLLIQRPRPAGHGIHVLWQIKDYWSFPSGHVEHALTFFGILLFLTYQIPRPAPWLRPVLWAVRLGLLAFIVLMAPSRLVEGQHWTSDVVAGYLYGAFWLILGIHAYGWAAQRWPRLLATGERERKRVAYAT
jgi:undecaprenyl-diphosphatase